MKSEDKEKIIKALEERFSKNNCPRCNNNEFTLMDGYFNQTLQDHLQGIVIGGVRSIPSVIVVCTQCGFMSQHAIGVLGLLPVDEDQTKPSVNNQQ